MTDNDYISGMKAGEIMFQYAHGEEYKRMFQAARKGGAVRVRKKGDGHATRWWYHKDDLERFCAQWVLDRRTEERDK